MIDWQQGNTSAWRGWNPLWALNHEHFWTAAGKAGGLSPSPATLGGQPPLSGRVLRRHGHLLGVAAVSALLYRHGVQHRVLLVEPRYRRPHAGRPRRRADRALGKFGCFRHPAAAQHQQPFNSKEPWKRSPESGRRRRFHAPAPQADPLSVQHEQAPGVEGEALVQPMYYQEPMTGRLDDSKRVLFRQRNDRRPITRQADRKRCWPARTPGCRRANGSTFSTARGTTAAAWRPCSGRLAKCLCW